MIPDYFEPIIAYRCWDVCNNGLLCSQAIPEHWPPYDAFTAYCRMSRNMSHGHLTDEGLWAAAPILHCGCGIHAYKDPAEAEARIVRNGRGSSRAWGAVALWGRLIEHTSGYRAQFAYPRNLHCENDKLAAKVQALYGVPCELTKLQYPPEEYYDDTYSTLRAMSNSSWYVPPKYIHAPQPQPPTPTPVPYAPDLSDLIGNRVIVTPSEDTIKLLDGSRWQQRQAARSIPPPKDWRDIMRRAFYAPKEKA